MENQNSEYRFYGNKNPKLQDIRPQREAKESYPGIETPYDLYDALFSVWSRKTCAPRLQEEWSPSDPTLGQCSITAFLVQDIFGGKVYGIRRPAGNFHCYNEVNGVTFDLTSEQFKEERLDYSKQAQNPEQFREVHFQKTEKQKRYEMLKKALEEKQTEE